MLVFRKKYFLFTLLLLVVEVIIALFVNDSIIRPYGGDFLVVILIYTFVRSFFKIGVYPTLAAVFLFATLTEFSQKMGLVKLLGLEGVRWVEIILGNTFSWEDLLVYALGLLLVLFIEHFWNPSA